MARAVFENHCGRQCGQERQAGLRDGVELLGNRLRRRRRICILVGLLPLAWCAALAVVTNLGDLDVAWLALAGGLIIDIAICLSLALASQRRWSQIVGYVLSFSVSALVAGFAVVEGVLYAVRDLVFGGQLPSMGSRSVEPRTIGGQVQDWSVAGLGLVVAVSAVVATLMLIAAHRKLRAIEPPLGPFRFTTCAIVPAIAWVLLAVLLCIAALCV